MMMFNAPKNIMLPASVRTTINRKVCEYRKHLEDASINWHNLPHMTDYFVSNFESSLINEAIEKLENAQEIEVFNNHINSIGV